MIKRLIFLICLTSATTFGQVVPYLIGGSAAFGGDLFAFGGIGLREITGLALKLTPPSSFTLTQTGAQVQTILDGTFATLNVGENLFHDGDPDTKIRFRGDRITINVGGIEILDLYDAGVENIKFNNSGGDMNFSVETVNNDRTFFIDAGADQIVHESPTPKFTMGDSDANTGGGATTYDSSAVIIEADGEPSITFYASDGDNGKIEIDTDNDLNFTGMDLTITAVSTALKLLSSNGENRFSFTAGSSTGDASLAMHDGTEVQRILWAKH